MSRKNRADMHKKYHETVRIGKLGAVGFVNVRYTKLTIKA